MNISSVAATLVEAGLLAYATTKGRDYQFHERACHRPAPHGITANAIAPGWVRTQMGAAQFTDKQLAVVNERIPLGRIASTDEIAGNAVFLLSGLSRYITGQVITVDGGETCEGTIKGIEVLTSLGAVLQLSICCHGKDSRQAFRRSLSQFPPRMFDASPSVKPL